MKLLQDRGYVLREGRVLIPSSLGRVLSEFLKGYFEKYIDYDFTATMEVRLSGTQFPQLSPLMPPLNQDG